MWWQPKINELEFIATFRFAVAITLVPMYLLIVSFILVSLVTLSMGFLVFNICFIIGLLAVKV